MGGSRQNGFTVVEVFLVITLLAVVAALMVVPVHRLVENIHVRPVEEKVLAIFREARSQAIRKNVSVLMYHHSESNQLELVTQEGELIENYALSNPEDEAPELLQLFRTLPEDPENDSISYEAEDEQVDFIVFHPTGVSTPFSIELLETDVRLVINPFSSEPLLREEGGGES